jgi:hypothetical protein
MSSTLVASVRIDSRRRAIFVKCSTALIPLVQQGPRASASARLR